MYLGIWKFHAIWSKVPMEKWWLGTELMLGSHLSKCIQEDANEESVSNEIKFKEER